MAMPKTKKNEFLNLEIWQFQPEMGKNWNDFKSALNRNTIYDLKQISLLRRETFTCAIIPG